MAVSVYFPSLYTLAIISNSLPLKEKEKQMGSERHSYFLSVIDKIFKFVKIIIDVNK